MPRKKADPSLNLDSLPPVSTAEARENQAIALAYDLAEKQLREGTASSQVIYHFLKMGSQKDRLEREILAEQKKLVTAKTKSIESTDKLQALFEDAVRAMTAYSGDGEAYED